MSLGYTLNSDDVSPFLTGVINSLGLGPNEVRPPLEKWGKYYIDQMPPMFRNSGRGRVRWPGLAASTRANYRAKGIQGAQPLFRTGAMMRSIKTAGSVGFGRWEQRVWSDNPFLPIHQAGATIGAREIRPKNKKALRFRVGGKWVFARKVNFPGAVIPARPSMFITDQDEQMAIKLLGAEINKLLAKGFKKTPNAGIA